MHLLEQLKAYDIDIDFSQAGPHARGTCRISIPQRLCQPLTDAPNISVSIDDHKSITLIEQEGSSWIFRAWECAPGPSEDDFVSAFPNVEDAIRAVLQYHLGGPTLLGPWLVPFHRHPELTFEQVRFVLSQAIMVSQETFAGIAERRHQKIFGNYQFGKSRWEWALQSQFLSLGHVMNPDLTLQLRRDAQEAYIVFEANT